MSGAILADNNFHREIQLDCSFNPADFNKGEDEQGVKSQTGTEIIGIMSYEMQSGSQ